MSLLEKVWHFHEILSTSVTIGFTVILCGSDCVCKQAVVKSSQPFDVITVGSVNVYNMACVKPRVIRIVYILSCVHLVGGGDEKRYFHVYGILTKFYLLQSQ